MTNADKIRNMSEEELAKLMNSSMDYFNCDMCEFRVDHGWCEGESCLKYILKWLKEEANE